VAGCGFGLAAVIRRPKRPAEERLGIERFTFLPTLLVIKINWCSPVNFEGIPTDQTSIPDMLFSVGNGRREPAALTGRLATLLSGWVCCSRENPTWNAHSFYPVRKACRYRESSFPHTIRLSPWRTATTPLADRLSQHPASGGQPRYSWQISIMP
jgi:hypothetical protein